MDLTRMASKVALKMQAEAEPERRSPQTPDPVKTKPLTDPTVRPERRFSPERVCPAQIERVVRRILPELP